jgi:hypothetical protein
MTFRPKKIIQIESVWNKGKKDSFGGKLQNKEDHNLYSTTNILMTEINKYFRRKS